MKLSKRDKSLIWHPFTQAKTASEVIGIKSASGAYVYDESGKAYLDLISSWWVNLHGHAHPKIARRIYEQAITLEHVIFAGFTHEPAVRLCENLQAILPAQLNKFFFSDNGSTAIEVALKMAYQYWRNLGHENRKTFLSFEGGYHGDTFGAMSVGARSGFHDQFSDLFFNVVSLPYPHTWDEDSEVEVKEAFALQALLVALEQNAIAAIVLEPLVQGASGMRMCRPRFVQQVVQIAHERNVLVIFDEVMTGFGRTGAHFALHHLDVVPDLLCLSKGLTGGFLPLALTVATNEIYNSFLGDNFKTALAHGHSYTANPLACSAALASLELLLMPACQESIVKINQAHKAGVELLKQRCKCVEKARVLGAISAFDVVDGEGLAPIIRKRCTEAGLLIRPLSNHFYLLPPYCITVDELERAYDQLSEMLP